MVGLPGFEPDSLHIAPYRRVLMCRASSNLRECLSHLVSVCRAVVAQRWHKYWAVPNRSSDRCGTECWSADDSVLLGFFLGNSERRIPNLCDHMVPVTDPKAHQLTMPSVLTLSAVPKPHVNAAVPQP